MNMPGFTAESSVYRTSGHYQMTAGFDANGGVIRPQACDRDCMSECVEACDYDFPPGRMRAQCVLACPRECGCPTRPQP